MSTKYKTIKRRVFEVIQIGNVSDIPSRAFDYFISILIVGVVAITFAMTFELSDGARSVLRIIEYIITGFFAVEYILRLWTSGYLYKGKKAPQLRFIFSFYGIIDLMTILACFVPLYGGIVALRLVRVVRILRLFQVNKRIDAFNVITEVLKKKSGQLLSSITMLLMIMIMASITMYGFEHDAQPEVFSNGFSGIWWAVSAILTVGYGDIYPVTVGGQIAAILISVLGVCVVAIPTGIISAGFVEYYTKSAEKTVRPDLIEEIKRRGIDPNKVLGDYLKAQKDKERDKK